MSVFGVIGLGSIGKKHVANLRKKYPKSIIYSVSSSGKNRVFPEDANALVSFEELISKSPNLVIVASPAPYHAYFSEALITKQIPILIEKPLSDKIEDCYRIIKLAEKNIFKKIAVGYCLRFLPSAQIIKKLIDANELGEIYSVHSSVGQYLPNWRNDKNYKNSVSAIKDLGGGALLELSHEIDYLIWFFGNLSIRNSFIRRSNELAIEVEDLVDISLVSLNNVFISMHADFLQKSPSRYCEIIAQKGRLYWNLLENSVTLFDEKGEHILFSNPEFDKNEMYISMIDCFQNLDKTSYSQIATILDGKNVVELIEKARLINTWKAD